MDVGKGLAGEAAGAHAGGDNGDDIHEASPERCRLVGFVHHQIPAEFLEVRVQFLMDFFHDLEHALSEFGGQVRGHLAAHLGHEGVRRDLVVPAVGVVLVLDFNGLAEHFLDHAEQVAHLHGLVAGEHDVLVGVFRAEDFHRAEGGVLDVDVLAQGRGRAVIGDRALFQRFGHETVDRVAAVGAGAVERTVAQDRVFEAEHIVIIFDIQFARLFAAPVEAAGLAVHVERAGEDVALDPGLAAGFEQDDVAEDVDARGFHGLLVGKAEIFTNSGMSVFNLFESTVRTKSGKKQDLEEVLFQQQYHTIYLMLGINELGYDYSSIIRKYQSVVDTIKTRQPNAVIVLGANLHVTAQKSSSSSTYTNEKINQINSGIRAIAENSDCCYIDVNDIFDDENGALKTSYSTDGSHVLGKYYSVWTDWLKGESPDA